MKKVCILDYGSGNVRSVFNMVSLLCSDVVVSNKESDIAKATHLILPGVGAFRSSMEMVREKLPLQLLEKRVLEEKIPFLGICVGMQILAEKGFEFGECQGLAWISGSVNKLEVGEMPLPHVGWNSIEVVSPSSLFLNLSPSEDFYFVHSYVFIPSDKSFVAATTNYDEKFCSVIIKDNIYGVQFHPEKSQKAGMTLLQNFLEL